MILIAQLCVYSWKLKWIFINLGSLDDAFKLSVIFRLGSYSMAFIRLFLEIYCRAYRENADNLED